MTIGPQRSTANIMRHLRDLRFPATREQLLDRARVGGAGQDTLEILESFPRLTRFATPAEVVKAYVASDQAPQTGIIDIKP